MTSLGLERPLEASEEASAAAATAVLAIPRLPGMIRAEAALRSVWGIGEGETRGDNVHRVGSGFKWRGRARGRITHPAGRAQPVQHALAEASAPPRTAPVLGRAARRRWSRFPSEAKANAALPVRKMMTIKRRRCCGLRRDAEMVGVDGKNVEAAILELPKSSDVDLSSANYLPPTPGHPNPMCTLGWSLVEPGADSLL